jgi:conflict system STAND superfamily ATPase
VTDNSPRVDPDNPWLGLYPFTEATRKYFFGRAAEIQEIFLRVNDHHLTILYGQAGYGKTSLLGAGLLPMLRERGYRPILIRLRYGDGDPPLLDQTRSALAEVYETSDESPSQDPAEPSSDAGGTPLGSPLSGEYTLWEYIHHVASPTAALADIKPVLVLDQFEEIFTLPTPEDGTPTGPRSLSRLEESRELFIQLADVIENRPPAAVEERFRIDRRLARDYDLASAVLRIVLTLREDYLPHLERWKKTLPSLMPR